MTASNHTKKKPTKAASASAFKRDSSPLVEIPSGNWVRLRRPGMEAFLTAGFLPDSLAKDIAKLVASKKGKAEDLKVLQEPTPEAVAEYMRAMDKIAAYCVTEPKVVWHERFATGTNDVVLEVIPEDERDSEVVYTDELDIEDKSFIFQYAVGGTADLSQFRQSADAVVAALQPVGDLGETP